MSSKYSMRESNRLGFGTHCTRSAHLLNRIVVAGEDQDGQRYVESQLDARRVEMALRVPWNENEIVVLTWIQF